MAKLTALYCVQLNDISSLRRLCSALGDKKQELEEKDFYGNTALLKACYLGRLEAADILLHFGANVKTINYYGQNALSLATYSGNLDLIRKLLLYCSYDEFNKTTLMPALCVATLLKNWQLYKFFIDLDRSHYEDIQTAHGLNSDDILNFTRMSSSEPNKPEPMHQ